MMVLAREEALQIVRTHIAKESNVKHMIAVGAVMRQLAIHLSEDQDRWEVVGILHDIDLERCNGMADHTIVAKALLGDKVDEEVVQAIMAHNAEATKVPVDTRLKIGLVASDATSGLVLACALVMPTKKLADVKKESLAKKFGNKDFAKGVSRERILFCEQLGLARDEFLELALQGMRARSEELGL
jgi:predicted hydrolase (HD superfamily)